MKRLAVVLLAVLVLLKCDSIVAQSQGGIALSPPSFDLSANPGETVANAIKVENATKEPVTLQVFAQNFTALGDGGQIALTDAESPYSLTSWIQLEKNVITVQPGSSTIVPFSIVIPRNAEPGSHYGAVVFRSREESLQAGSGASVTTQIGSLILLRLPGAVYTKAGITSFSASRNIYTDERISFSASIINEGNVHVKPYGFITIRNLLGQDVKTIEVRGRNVLPGATRSISEESIFSGVGYFTAELNLLYADGGSVMKKKTSFFSLQFARTLPIALAAAAVGVVFFVFRRRIRKAFSVLLRGEL